MPTLHVFNQISIDGYFKSSDGDVGWTHRQRNDPELDAFVQGNAASGGRLLFGRVTWEAMASFWPTPMAAEQFPEVAKHMNRLEKLVVSRTLEKPGWSNSTVLRGDLEGAIRRIKREPGTNITILGSGSVVAQLAKAGLIDEYGFLVIPTVLGKGTTMFDAPLDLRLKSTRAFPCGKVYLTYEPNK